MNNKKILLVDDDEDMLMLCSRELSKAGYDTVTARNGREFLKILAERKPEIMLVVLDVFIPDIDGRRLALQAKNISPEIPIIFHSHYGYKDKLSVWGIPEDADYVIKGKEKELLSLISKRTDNLSSKEDGLIPTFSI